MSAKNEENENKGFIINLTVEDIDTIKPRKADTFKDSDGEEIKYGYAVKFKTRTIDIVDDEDWGDKEVETTLEVEIPCEAMEDTKNLNALLKLFKIQKVPFTLPIQIPRFKDKSYTAKSLLYSKKFITDNSKLVKK